MKKAIAFLSVLNCLNATAQYHGAENNYYTYSEKDSVQTVNNYVATVFADGKTLLWPYGGQLQMLGNNYTVKAPAPVDGIILHPKFCRVNKEEIWITQATKAYLFRNSNIIDSFNSRGEIYLMNIDNAPTPVLWYTYKKDELYFVASYVKGQLKEWGKLPFKLDIIPSLWLNDKGNMMVGKPNEYCTLSNYGMGPVLKFSLPASTYHILSFNRRSSSIIVKTIETNQRLFSIKQHKIRQIQTSANVKDISLLYDDVAVINYTNNHKEIIRFSDSSETVISRFYNDDSYSDLVQVSNGSFYLGGHNKLIRTFSYIKKYPNLFNGSSSASIFSIQQDNDGAIWAGSYGGYLSRIKADGLQSIKTDNIFISNGGCVIDDKVYLVGEGINNGLLQFNKKGQLRKITKQVTGFINYIDSSNNLLYFGTSGSGLWYTAIKKLNDAEVKWEIISREHGLELPNIVTITKDKKGRFWLGQPSRGWAVYTPQQKKAVTRLIEKKETDFGLMSSYTDSHGTVWLGSKQKGLLFYNNYRSDTVAASDINTINHPLLQNGKTITAIKQWGSWLIFGATDYYLALDLNAWYQSKQVLIRYLNPQEAAFTGTTEQNTLLVDKRDSSVWFSTTDMLYQWDFKNWLSLPSYKISANVEMVLNGKKIKLNENESFGLEPVENNLNFSIWFQSPDNMPRYLSAALFKKGDSLDFPVVSLTTHFNYTNIAPGKYILAVQICQLDGSVSIHQFPITIKNFWWQLWWVWLVAFLLCTLIAVYIINIRRKKILAEAIIKRKEAEMETFKEAQQKKLAHLQLVSLSNQFRPHFILNALNTIGAQMDKNPQAESVLSRLGESINLIFNHAQQQQMAHSFADEWTLVKNIINIHQLMYLKNLAIKLPSEEALNLLDNSKVPLGLIQIPVENALLHGLSNKENGPWLLEIVVDNNSNAFVITITDNGVGRKKAGSLSNYRKHGTGTKNLSEILSILNENKTEQITIVYKDDIFIDAVEPYGTSVIVTLPKTFKYDA